MATLYIVRGLPGSGKSTLVRKLVAGLKHFEADMFFLKADGGYKFDAGKIYEARQLPAPKGAGL